MGAEPEKERGEQFCRCGNWITCTKGVDKKGKETGGRNSVHMLRETKKCDKKSKLISKINHDAVAEIENYKDLKDAEQSYVILTNAKKLNKEPPRFVQVVPGQVEVTSKIYAVTEVDTKLGVFGVDVVLM